MNIYYRQNIAEKKKQQHISDRNPPRHRAERAGEPARKKERKKDK